MHGCVGDVFIDVLSLDLRREKKNLNWARRQVSNCLLITSQLVARFFQAHDT